MARPKYGVNCCNCCLLSSDLDFCTCGCHYDRLHSNFFRRNIAKGSEFRNKDYQKNGLPLLREVGVDQ